MKRKWYLIAVLLLCCSVTGCRNPWMEKLVGHLIKDDTIYVSNRGEWETAIQKIEEGGNDKSYRIILTRDFDYTPLNSYQTFDGVIGIKVTIEGNKTITLNGNDSLLSIASGQDITIKNVHLKGQGLDTDINFPLVSVYGHFTMTGNASVSGNKNRYGEGGGGVAVFGGTFIMNGGTIYGNNVSGPPAWGGGVYINAGTFTMTGGTIYDNAADHGGGVYISGGGTFNLLGGKVVGVDGWVPGYGANIASQGVTLYVDNGTANIIGMLTHTSGQTAENTIPP